MTNSIWIVFGSMEKNHLNIFVVMKKMKAYTVYMHNVYCNIALINYESLCDLLHIKLIINIRLAMKISFKIFNLIMGQYC